MLFYGWATNKRVKWLTSNAAEKNLFRCRKLPHDITFNKAKETSSNEQSKIYCTIDEIYHVTQQLHLYSVYTFLKRFCFMNNL